MPILPMTREELRVLAKDITETVNYCDHMLAKHLESSSELKAVWTMLQRTNINLRKLVEDDLEKLYFPRSDS